MPSSPCSRYELLAFKIAAGGAGPSSLRAVTVNLPASFSGIPWPRALVPPLVSKPECLFSSTPRDVGGKQSPEPIIAEPIHTTADPIGRRKHETALHGALVLPSLILSFRLFDHLPCSGSDFPLQVPIKRKLLRLCLATDRHAA
jgi:hypothetical protein